MLSKITQIGSLLIAAANAEFSAQCYVNSAQTGLQTGTQVTDYN
jgi:hypothetical protein